MHTGARSNLLELKILYNCVVRSLNGYTTLPPPAPEPLIAVPSE